jgi:hypothetical protein
VTQKICPIMTAGYLKPPEPSSLVLPNGGVAAREAPEMIPCVGASCGFWLTMHDADNKPVAGGCGVGMAAAFVNNGFGLLANTLVQLGTKPQEGTA